MVCTFTQSEVFSSSGIMDVCNCTGISATSHRPFSPPIDFRTTERCNPAKHERSHILEGKCHKCKRWIPVESVKDMDIKVILISIVCPCHHNSVRVKVKELYWYVRVNKKPVYRASSV